MVDLQTANVDLLNSVQFQDLPTLKGDSSVQVWSVPGVVRDHVGFNNSRPPFQNNPNLQRAIAWVFASLSRITMATPAGVPPPLTWTEKPRAS